MKEKLCLPLISQEEWPEFWDFHDDFHKSYSAWLELISQWKSFYAAYDLTWVKVRARDFKKYTIERGSSKDLGQLHNFINGR